MSDGTIGTNDVLYLNGGENATTLCGIRTSIVYRFQSNQFFNKIYASHTLPPFDTLTPSSTYTLPLPLHLYASIKTNVSYIVNLI